MKYRFKRLLKIFFILLLILLIGLLTFEFITSSPKNLQFTNITSNSVTLSWDTILPQGASAVSISPQNKLPVLLRPFLKEEYYDTRDIRKAELESVSKTSENIQNSEELTFNNFHTEISVTKRGRYYTHHVEITGLESEKEYSFMIGNALLFQRAIDGNSSSVVKTLSVPKSIPTPRPAYGSILDAENKGDTSIQDLTKITDGIVYINYLDKASDKRSSIVSGSLNEDGYWYVDMSSALNSKGAPFFEEYIGTETELSVEIQLNAGPLGKWKTTREESITSPASPIIINVPDISKDIPDATIEIEDNDKSVLGLSLPETAIGECAFSDYCIFVVKKDGKYISSTKTSDCTNKTTIESTLKTRNCTGGGAPQENTSCGNGAAKLGEVKLYNSDCMVCSTKEQNGYYIGFFRKNNDLYDPANNCAPKQQDRVKKGNEELCNAPQGCFCTANGMNIKINEYCTDGRKVQLDPGTRCNDHDGCICLNSMQASVNYNGVCIAKEDSGGQTGEGNNNGCLMKPDNSACITNDNKRGYCKDNVCLPYTNSGSANDQCPFLSTGPCTTDDGRPGHCVAMNCIAYSDPTPEEEKIACWENHGYSQLYKGEGDNTMVCNYNHEWVLNQSSNYKSCNGGDRCNGNYICLSGDNKLYFCGYASLSSTESTLLPYPEEGKTSKVAIEATMINPGEKCDEGPCLCNNEVLDTSNYCIETAKCNSKNVGKVCKTDGTKCSDQTDGYFYCNVQPEKTDNTGLQNMNINVRKNVFASSNVLGAQDYVIDSQTGTISGLKEGVFLFEYNGKPYVFNIEQEELDARNGEISIYIDNNKNNIYDEGVDTKISDLGSQISISTLKQSYKYSLKEGFNFITIPFLIDNGESRTAAGLLNALNSVYGDLFYSISKYDGKWKTVGQNVEQYDMNDFQLIPGQGYIIKSSKTIDISILGSPVIYDSTNDKAPITLYQGWNLIGTYGSNIKQYTAKTLIEGISNYKPIDFTADNVSRWESDVQRYDGLQITNENGIDITYGFDFPINSQQAYFVRILQGKGNWQPELK